MTNILLKYLLRYCDAAYKGYRKYVMQSFYKARLGHCGKNVNLRGPFYIDSLEKVFIGDDVGIMPELKIVSAGGKVIIKKNSGLSSRVTIITGNHKRELGAGFAENGSGKRETDEEYDLIINEDVWIGANVTICSKANIGRGATIGAGAVVITKVPPYAIVIGNPAKVVGFNFTPEEIVEHEKKLYPEEERIPLETLEKNYNKYFINRIKEIKEFTRL